MKPVIGSPQAERKQQPSRALPQEPIPIGTICTRLHEGSQAAGPHHPVGLDQRCVMVRKQIKETVSRSCNEAVASQRQMTSISLHQHQALRWPAYLLATGIRLFQHRTREIQSHKAHSRSAPSHAQRRDPGSDPQIEHQTFFRAIRKWIQQVGAALLPGRVGGHPFIQPSCRAKYPGTKQTGQYGFDAHGMVKW